ncbi:MAG TPA: DinB family protein [Phaeodactylibacter sp.]|nr:DinB family protein [Phaeodactylibacter sp.]
MRKNIEKKLDTLDQELKLLLRDLKQLSNKDLAWKPTQDKWSILEVMQHMIIAEELSLKYIQKKMSFQPKLKRAGVVTSGRKAMLWLYLNMPFKVKAPQLVAEDMFIEGVTFWDLVKRWNSLREKLREYLASLPDDIFSKALYKHPVTGRMSLDGMLTFFIQHFRRHRKQIQAILLNFKY